MMGRTYRTAVSPTSAQPPRHYAGCALFCFVVALVLVALVYWRTRPAESEPMPTAQAAIIANEDRRPCVAVSVECGSIVPRPANHAITGDERAALAAVYPTSEAIPDGVDSACYWANRYGVACADVKAATLQMEAQ